MYVYSTLPTCVSCRQGSIRVDAILTFQDTGLVESSEDVENVINSTSRALNWTVVDAREMGDFVVCRHCATVTLRRTTLATLPRKPILLEDETRGKASVVVVTFFPSLSSCSLLLFSMDLCVVMLLLLLLELLLLLLHT